MDENPYRSPQSDQGGGAAGPVRGPGAMRRIISTAFITVGVCFVLLLPTVADRKLPRMTLIEAAVAMGLILAGVAIRRVRF